jgi:hypothetical protein
MCFLHEQLHRAGPWARVQRYTMRSWFSGDRPRRRPGAGTGRRAPVRRVQLCGRDRPRGGGTRQGRMPLRIRLPGQSAG